MLSARCYRRRLTRIVIHAGQGFIRRLTRIVIHAGQGFIRRLTRIVIHAGQGFIRGTTLQFQSLPRPGLFQKLSIARAMTSEY